MNALYPYPPAPAVPNYGKRGTRMMRRIRLLKLSGQGVFKGAFPNNEGNYGKPKAHRPFPLIPTRLLPYLWPLLLGVGRAA